jgi:hypothetical protein
MANCQGQDNALCELDMSGYSPSKSQRGLHTESKIHATDNYHGICHDCRLYFACDEPDRAVAA